MTSNAFALTPTRQAAATRSFYGIKSISLRSSTNWRQNNRMWVFMSALSLLLLTYASIFLYQETHNESGGSWLISTFPWTGCSKLVRLVHCLRQPASSASAREDTELIVNYGRADSPLMTSTQPELDSEPSFL